MGDCGSLPKNIGGDGIREYTTAEIDLLWLIVFIGTTRYIKSDPDKTTVDSRYLDLAYLE